MISCAIKVREGNSMSKVEMQDGDYNYLVSAMRQFTDEEKRIKLQKDSRTCRSMLGYFNKSST